MTDKRPKELIKRINDQVDSNNLELSDALDSLQAEVLKGKSKATMTNLRRFCSLSEGAIRKRPWAILRLKSIKKNAKSQKTIVKKEPQEKTEVQLLTERVKNLLTENAILFEEIVVLQKLVSRRERENKALEKRYNIRANNRPELK